MIFRTQMKNPIALCLSSPQRPPKNKLSNRKRLPSKLPNRSLKRRKKKPQLLKRSPTNRLRLRVDL